MQHFVSNAACRFVAHACVDNCSARRCAHSEHGRDEPSRGRHGRGRRDEDHWAPDGARVPALDIGTVEVLRERLAHSRATVARLAKAAASETTESTRSSAWQGRADAASCTAAAPQALALDAASR